MKEINTKHIRNYEIIMSETGSTQHILQRWSTMEESTIDEPKKTRAYLRVVKNQGKDQLEAVEAKDLGIGDRLRAYFHVGEFSLSKIVAVVEQALPQSEEFSPNTGAALRRLQARVSNARFRHKSEKKALLDRVTNLLSPPKGPSTEKTGEARLQETPLPPGEQTQLPKSFKWPEGIQSFVKILLEHKKPLPSLRFFMSQGPSYQTVTAHFMSMKNAMETLQDIIELKRGDKAIPEEKREKLAQELGEIVGERGALEGLQALCTMFNVEVSVEGEEGEKPTVIHPKTPMEGSLCIVLGEQGFSIPNKRLSG
jgi:hypothetical protein